MKNHLFNKQNLSCLECFFKFHELKTLYKGLSITNILPLAQSSHAVSEIHTSKGWLGVDSLEPFMLLT